MNSEKIVYFDNAATSWPKPPQVRAALVDYLENVGGSPGRSGHRRSIAASRIINEARETLADLFGSDDPGRISFTKNSTEALNFALFGLLRPGDHVLTSSIEHNSVMRPLRYLEAQGTIELTVLPCSPAGLLDPLDLRRALRRNSRLVVLLHGSNVIGNLLPIAEVSDVAHAAGVPVLLDASQTAGACPIDVEALGVDLLAFTGHKSLLGPTGTGGLWIREGIDLPPLLRGGTGSRSELEIQPEFMPDAFEAGTLNVLGLAGLGASVRYLLEIGVEHILAHERSLVARFLEGAGESIIVYGPEELEQRIGVISFNVKGISASEVGLALDRAFGIMTRIGLHCAPAAHRTLGTFPNGTVRFGFSFFNTLEEVDYALEALHCLIEEKVRG